MKVETQAEAAQLNRDETFGPYAAANGHLMVAALRFPREAIDQQEWPADRFPNPPMSVSREREYRVGDEIRYDSWSAWCAPGCSHAELGPLPDW